MDDDGDLHEGILHIEAHIEELADVIERCRKIIVISKTAIATGGTLIFEAWDRLSPGEDGAPSRT